MKATDVLLIGLGILVFIAGIVVWLNRDSEKIVSTIIPAGIVAVIGVLLGVLVFGQQPPIDVTFPAYFQYEGRSHLP